MGVIHPAYDQGLPLDCCTDGLAPKNSNPISGEHFLDVGYLVNPMLMVSRNIITGVLSLQAL